MTMPAPQPSPAQRRPLQDTAQPGPRACDNSPAHADIRACALQALAQVVDPESGLDIVEMGLVEAIHIGPTAPAQQAGPPAHPTTDAAAGTTTDAAAEAITVDLIMTSAACPMAHAIADDAEAELALAFGARRLVQVRVLDSPAWHPGRLGPTARATMGWDEEIDHEQAGQPTGQRP